VAITHDAVYVTDSFNAQLVVIPLAGDGSLPPPSAVTLLPVTGDFAQTPRPNLNHRDQAAAHHVKRVPPHFETVRAGQHLTTKVDLVGDPGPISTPP
jgi:hypothetical protein